LTEITLSGFPVAQADSTTATLVLVRDPSLRFPSAARPEVLHEGYALEIGLQQIRLTAREEVGLFRGLQTLRQILRQTVQPPCLNILDWPDLPVRGLHLTLGSGNMPTPAKLRELVVGLARHKLNYLTLEYDDRFPFARHPKLVHPDALTLDDLQGILQVAADNHVEIVPALDSLGHAQAYLRHPAYRHLAEITGNNEEMCPSNPRVLAFIKELWTEILDLHTGCKFAHITGDEVFRLGRFCPKCNRHARNGTLSELYCSYYGDLARWAIERGRRPIIWADMILAHPERLASLPREIVWNDWDYRGVFGPPEALRLWGRGVILEESWSSLPAAVQRTWKRYLFCDSDRPHPAPFPYVRFLQDQGFDVLGATASSGAYFLPLPSFSDRISNNHGFAQAMHQARGLGVLNTYWSDDAPLFAAWHGILAGAASDWNTKSEINDDLLSRMETLFLEQQSGRLSDFAERIDLIQFRKRDFPARRSTRVNRSAPPKAAAKADPMGKDYARLLNVNGDLALAFEEVEKLAAEVNAIIIGQGRDEPITIEPYLNLAMKNCLPGNEFFLSGIGSGAMQSWGVPFILAAPGNNRGHSVVATCGRLFPERPSQVTIPVIGCFSRLFFLHTSAYAARGVLSGNYRMVYEDGRQATLDLVCGQTTGDWYRGTFPLERAVVAWEGNMEISPELRKVAYLTWWDNPRPRAPLAAVDILGTKTGGFQFLLALTGRTTTCTPKVTSKKLLALTARIRAVRTRLSDIERCFKATYAEIMSIADTRTALSRLLTHRLRKLLKVCESRVGELTKKRKQTAR